MNDDFISKMKEKNIGRTKYGNHTYSNLWYVDNNNKVCFTFSPRGGCSIAFKLFLDLNSLLEDAIKFKPWIHDYRCEIIGRNTKICNINYFIKNNYSFIKFIMNPYIRAVSCYRPQRSHNLSFREYMRKIVHDIDFLEKNEKYHMRPQYIDGEENIITKYIKIDKYEKYDITLQDGSLYTLDVNKYSSTHHAKKNVNNTTFCGDCPRRKINNNLPYSYKYFYDDEIRELVEKFYKQDIEKYGYKFEDFDN